MKILFLLLTLFFPVQSIFPMGRCYDKVCNSSPYTLDISSNNGSRFCFKPKSQQCVNTKYNCCNKFETELYKIILSSRPECKSSIRRVTVNNVTKGGGVYFDLYNNKTYAEVRLTTLKMNQTVALNSEICIFLKDVCDTFDKFKGIGMWSVFDPLQHTCCPTCSFATSSLSPPPSPSPPSPSPPLPPSPRPPLPPPASQSFTNCTCTCPV